MRQVVVFRVAAERELQHAHSGNFKIVSKGLDIRGDHAQVLGDNRQIAQLFLESSK